MQLIQINDPALKLAYSESFDFQSPPGVGIMYHKLVVGGNARTVVGCVATENLGHTGVPHIMVYKDWRDKETLATIGWTFKHVYAPLMKALGMFVLITNCDQSDTGTVNFLTKLDFEIKEICVAQYVL